MLARRSFLAITACELLGAATLHAADAGEQLTLIQVKAMHCSHCAKKITHQLQTVDGVRDVKADHKKDTALVAAAKSKSLSPRALWEAVEAAGFQPVKLSGPSGTYTTKPGK